MVLNRRTLLLVLVVGGLPAVAAEHRLPWSPADLAAVPRTFEAPPTTEPGVRVILFEGPLYQGKPTRVFAYYGAPPRRGVETLPAMVLVHGGGGTAYAEWVRMWNARGYAAIAMDTVGTIPEAAAEPKKAWNPDRHRHEFSGPAGWGDFANVDSPPQDQWTYHAVAAVVRAHSLLRSLPEVDPKRIGVTGISWGGYLTSIVSGVDARFRFAAPVYGCGFLGEDSAWLKDFANLGPQRAQRWLGLWDPSQYLGRSKMPMLWVNGTNDFAYPPPSWRRSYRLPKGPRTLAYRVRMPHGHLDGAKPEEIFQFADAIFSKGAPPVRITRQGTEKNQAWVGFKRSASVTRAELAFTRETGKWQTRKWETAPAQLRGGRASALIPDGARAYYLNLFDAQNRVVSGEYVDR